MSTRTKYSVEPKEKSRQFMQMAGVPPTLLTPFKFDLDKLVQAWSLSKDQVVTKAKQIGWYDQLQNRHDDFLAVISSHEHYLTARQVALVIFWQHIVYALNEAKVQSLPIWHSPSTNFNNELMESYNSGGSRAPTLLVLDNIYAEMSAVKTDKVIDILQTIGNRPRLILYRGQDARQYCIQRLGVRPNCIIQIGNTGERKITKI